MRFSLCGYRRTFICALPAVLGLREVVGGPAGFLGGHTLELACVWGAERQTCGLHEKRVVDA